jgi:alkaline phosphatase D
MDRRRFLKWTAAFAVTTLTQSACDDDGSTSGADTAAADTGATDTGGGTDAADSSGGEDSGTGADAQDATDAGDAVEDVTHPPPDYPRGEAPVFEASEVAPADPGAVDGAQAFAFDPEAVTEDAALFPCGVQAGEMTAAGCLLWTFVEDAAQALSVRVWRPSQVAGEVLLVSEQAGVLGADGYVHVQVEGLAAGTVYFYAFGVADVADASVWTARSRVGRVRTAFLEDGVGVVRIGASTCTNYSQVPFTSLDHMAKANLDMFLHLGDMTYNDSASDLESYRALWQRTLREPNMQAVLASTGFYMTWDDHEVDNNWNIENIPPARFATAKDAIYETLALARLEDDRMWRSHRWGSTLEIFALDCRGERRPSTIESESPVYIGAEQMAWLKAGLLNSPCRFKVVLNSVPATLFPGFLSGAALDNWNGYQVQRKELLDHIIDNNVRDVWFLSGDFHFGFISRLERHGNPSQLWELAVGPGASNSNPLPIAVAQGLRGFEEEKEFPDDMFPYWSPETKVATILELDAAAGTLRAQYILGDTGEVLFDEVLRQVM